MLTFSDCRFSSRERAVKAAPATYRSVGHWAPSKPNLVDPSLEQRHWEALAITCADGSFLMAQECPPNVLGATSGPQPILRPMPQRMDYLPRIDDSAVIEEPVQAFRGGGRAALEQR